MRLWLAAWGESPQQTEGLHMRENAKAFRSRNQFDSIMAYLTSKAVAATEVGYSSPIGFSGCARFQSPLPFHHSRRARA